MTETPEIVYCRNEDHTESVPAVARLSWPDGRFNPTTACAEDLEMIVSNSLDDGHVVLVEPVAEHESHAYRSYTVTHAIKELVRTHRREVGRDVRAILMEAPDQPYYEQLPETLEERQKLPARFHVPQWTESGTPQLWVCAVCWDEGSVSQWPCQAAAENGGEVFAR
ncbi:hypothetical protein AB0395_45620 [Streptosporangium sp. NPDC051023]|uniref:hypothetical protein n=1 Tax=Streptosporangium sp. NPDC051023 TaxID=3155410 RepID=UPI00344E353E